MRFLFYGILFLVGLLGQGIACGWQLYWVPQCDCSGNIRNCSDFNGSQFIAQFYYECCKNEVGVDISRLDADNDGIACEVLKP